MRRTAVRQRAGARWVAPFHRMHKARGWVHKHVLAPLGQLLRASSAATSPLHRITTTSSAAAAACEAPLSASTPRRSRWPGDAPGIARARSPSSYQLHPSRRELPLARLQLAHLTTPQDAPPSSWSLAIGAPPCSRR